jgi:hypothetical protein
MFFWDWLIGVGGPTFLELPQTVSCSPGSPDRLVFSATRAISYQNEGTMCRYCLALGHVGLFFDGDR